MVDFHIYADEAWTHSSNPMGRYWCFFGGIFGSQADLDRLNKKYILIRNRHGFDKEIKWSSLGEGTVELYKKIMDVFFDFLMSSENTLVYRQFFTDRAYIHKDSFDNKIDRHSVEVQFKLYYQFLKHMFPVEKLPGKPIVKVHLDNHTAQKYKEQLKNFLVQQWRDIDVKIDYVKSSKINHIQAVDLIIGMSGFRGNKILYKTSGSSSKRKLKQNFSKYVYDKMREVDSHHRKSKAFNLFGSTSDYQYKNNPFSQKIKIWKFQPRECYRDKGWENDHLSVRGEYQGEDLYYRDSRGEWKSLMDSSTGQKKKF